MKKITMSVFAVVVISLMTCLSSIAQELKVGFTVPFSFYVGGAKLPSGTYSLRPMQEDPNIYIVQNAAGTHSVMIDARQSSKTTNGASQVVFNKYPTGEYLEGILTSTGNSVDFETGTAEKVAAKKGTPQSHTVPAK